MTPDRRTRVLAEGLCCPRCSDAVLLGPLDTRPATWQDATYRVSCTSGDDVSVVSGRDIRDLLGVALRAA